MWTYNALIFPHKPDAILQGQLVEIDLGWLLFEDDWRRHLPFGILKHLCNHLILSVYDFNNAIAELRPDASSLRIIDFF